MKLFNRKTKERISIILCGSGTIICLICLVYFVWDSEIRKVESRISLDTAIYRLKDINAGPLNEVRELTNSLSNSLSKSLCELCWKNYEADVRDLQIILRDGYQQGYKDAKNELALSIPSATMWYRSYFEAMKKKCEMCDKGMKGD